MTQSKPAKSKWVTVGLLLLVCSAIVPAQISQASGPLLLAMAANSKQVLHYGWKQRITVVRKGKPAEPVINQVGFDSSGQMQRTTISAPPREMGGIRGRVAGDVKKNVEDIMKLAAEYNQPKRLVTAIQKAQISEAPATNTKQLRASNVIKPGDAITMFTNAKTNLASHVNITTDYDGTPMSVAQNYESLPGGPNVMKSMKVSVPGKDLVINVDSYDFRQQTAGLQ